MKFINFMPDTIFTKKVEDILYFYKKYKKIILKPIHSYSGYSDFEITLSMPYNALAKKLF